MTIFLRPLPASCYEERQRLEEFWSPGWGPSVQGGEGIGGVDRQFAELAFSTFSSEEGCVLQEVAHKPLSLLSLRGSPDPTFKA